MRDIERCRTAALGGHLEQCDGCGHARPAYNSCRNRACPKCQSFKKARWLAATKRDLLPVPYFHAVFTLPHEVNAVAWANKRTVCDLLFRAVASTLKKFAADDRHGLHGQLGFIAILHTWDQQMADHLHLHCLIAGGVLSPDRSKWIPGKDNFLFPVKALSQVFRGKFTAALQKAHTKKSLQFPAGLAHLDTPDGFAKWLSGLRKKSWVVYCKKPVAGPKAVLDYLARYTHRVAISNHRIVDFADGKVTFTCRDREKTSGVKPVTLEADEFIRRFLRHIPPDRYMRIRRYGFLANVWKAHSLKWIRQLLNAPEPPPQPIRTPRQLMIALMGVDPAKCPRCPHGTMFIVARIGPDHADPQAGGPPWPQIPDTS